MRFSEDNILNFVADWYDISIARFEPMVQKKKKNIRSSNHSMVTCCFEWDFHCPKAAHSTPNSTSALGLHNQSKENFSLETYFSHCTIIIFIIKFKHIGNSSPPVFWLLWDTLPLWTFVNGTPLFFACHTYIHNWQLQPFSQDYWPSFSHHICCVY